MAKKKISSKTLFVKNVNEETFWNKWLALNELDQEKYIQTLVPTIEMHWKAMQGISKDVTKGEVLRLKASLLNSYFLDLLKTINVQKRNR